MDRVTCSACRKESVPVPPNRSYWGLIVAFWAFSLLFGLGAAFSGWGLILMLGWLFMACSVGVMAQKATSYTCPVCGASVVPPVSATASGGRVMTPA